VNGHHPRPRRHGLLPASHVRSWRAIITARGSRPPIVSRQVLNGRHHPRHPSVTASSQRRGRSCSGFTSSHSCRECLSGEDSSARKKRISSSHPKKKKTPTKSAQENSPARIRRRPLVATTNATSPAEDTLSAHHTNHHLRQLVCRYASRSYTTNIVGDQQCWMQLLCNNHQHYHYHN
jgi:hypothetical protein